MVRRGEPLTSLSDREETVIRSPVAHANLRGASQASVRFASFISANVRYASFADADLTGAVFGGVRLLDVDMTRAVVRLSTHTTTRSARTNSLLLLARFPSSSCTAPT